MNCDTTTQQITLNYQELKDMALQIRRDTIRMISFRGSGHPGGALGIADILAALYGYSMDHAPDRLNDPHRDRLVLSNGHICAAWYSVLSLQGYIPREELSTHRAINSRLQGHPARDKLPLLVDTSSGPLGQGLSVANGLALAKRLDGHSGRVYCIVGDGEMQEGIIWEALLTSSHFKLANLTLIVAFNNLQIDGEVAKIKNLEPLAEKLSSFGWKVIDINGHDFDQIVQAFEAAKGEKNQPAVVIARTIMGKGIPFMENDPKWHGACPSPEEAKKALEYLGYASNYSDFPVPEEAE